MTAATCTAGGAPPRGDETRWGHPAVHGLLWGVAVTLLEAVALPLRDMGSGGLGRMVVGILPGWCAVGVVLAHAARALGARLERPWVLAASIVAGAPALSALWSALTVAAEAVGWPDGAQALFPTRTDALASFAYQAWVVAFYGGLYLYAWALVQRAERTRRLLDRAGVARLRTETLLGEAKLDALAGQVDARILVRAMDEVDRRYAAAPADADRLVGLLVALLRRAMPGVRSVRSTLAAELDLARAHDALLAELEPRRARWAFAAPPDLHRVAFPALVLLALLDALAAAQRGPCGVLLAVTADGAGHAVRIDDAGSARAGWLSPDLAYRLRVGLSRLYGDDYAVTQREDDAPGAPALVLRIGTRGGAAGPA